MRRKKGWSQSELGRRAGVHPASISQIESGRLNPYPIQLEKIADALEVDAEKLHPRGMGED